MGKEETTTQGPAVLSYSTAGAIPKRDEPPRLLSIGADFGLWCGVSALVPWALVAMAMGATSFFPSIFIFPAIAAISAGLLSTLSCWFRLHMSKQPMRRGRRWIWVAMPLYVLGILAGLLDNFDSFTIFWLLVFPLIRGWFLVRPLD